MVISFNLSLVSLQSGNCRPFNPDFAGVLTVLIKVIQVLYARLLGFVSD